MEAKNPNVDLQDLAFRARVKSVLNQEKKEDRKRLVERIVLLAVGTLIGVIYETLSVLDSVTLR
jgi:hypothetical protein